MSKDQSMPLEICGMKFRSLAQASSALGMNRDYVRWTMNNGSDEARRVMLGKFRALKAKLDRDTMHTRTARDAQEIVAL